MSLSIKPFLLLSSCMALVSYASANERAPSEETVVTGTKTEVALEDSLASVTVFTAEDIKEFQVQDLPSLLQRVSGVSVTASGGRGSVSSLLVRGTKTNQTVVLVDGMRTASATSGDTALGKIPLSAIEKIEIVKGPLSALYGADAMGGVIQVFTKRGKEGVGGSVTASVGNYATNKQGGEFYYGKSGLNISATLHREEQTGFDRTDDSINTDDDVYRELSGSASVLYNTEMLRANIAYLRNDGKVHFDNVSGPDSNHYSETDFENVSASVSFSPSPLLNVKANAGYFVDDSINPAYESKIKTQRDLVGLQVDLVPLESLVVTVGTDYSSDNVSGVTGRHSQTNEFQTYEEDNRENSGAFLQLQTRTQWMSAVGSVRYDDNEAYGSSKTGSVALEFPLGELVRIVPSYGTAFSAPTFNDLYWPDYGNKDLLPQESKSGELAFKLSSGALKASLAFYSTTVENQIVNQVDAGIRNIDVAELEGKEIEVSWGQAIYRLSVQVSYVDARDAITQEKLNDRPELSGHIYGYWQVLSRLGLSVNVRGERGRNDAYWDSASSMAVQERLPGFALVDLGGRYRLTDSLDISLQVNNVLDKEYVTNFASSSANYRNYGVNGTLTVNYTF